MLAVCYSINGVGVLYPGHVHGMAIHKAQVAHEFVVVGLEDLRHQFAGFGRLQGDFVAVVARGRLDIEIAIGAFTQDAAELVKMTDAFVLSRGKA